MIKYFHVKKNLNIYYFEINKFNFNIFTITIKHLIFFKFMINKKNINI